MKNLIVYINKSKIFDDESLSLTRVQIDNSLRLGWKAKDIILLTNFSFRYRSIESVIIDNCSTDIADGRSNKIRCFQRFLEDHSDKNETYFYHDLDAFQLVEFESPLKRGYDFAVATYGFRIGSRFYKRKIRLNTGVMFIRKSALDIFADLADRIDKAERNIQELELTRLYKSYYRSRIQIIDNSFNFGPRHIDKVYRRSAKPIKIAHFHPTQKGEFPWKTLCTKNNPINKQIVSESVINHLKCHKIAWSSERS